MIKAIIRKELREQLKIGALGLLAFTLLVFWHHRAYLQMLDALVHDYPNAGYLYGSQQPLVLPQFLSQTGVLCAALGLLLGWLQIFGERNRDLRAFLIHRPASRTTLFLGKAAAGLIIYLLAAGIPLTWFVIWIAIPGHVVAPFEWGMTMPLVGFILTGLGFYFAAMLTGLRQVRWYGTRIFAVGMAFLVGLAGMVSSWPPWVGVLVMLLGISLLAMAAWGTFRSLGQHQNLTRPTRLALVTSLVPGALFAICLVGALLSLFLSQNSSRYSNYVMSFNGQIYKLSQGGRQPPEIVDLVGNPVLLPNGHPVDALQFNNNLNATSWQIQGDALKRRPKDDFPRQYFSVLNWGRNGFWYYWSRYGRLVMFDFTTREVTGSLGPAGFATNLTGSGDRFGSPTYAFDLQNSVRTITSPTTLYHVDLLNRAVTPVFRTDQDDQILATQEIRGVLNGSSSTNLITVSNALGVTTRYVQPTLTNTLVLTKRFVQLLNADGNVIWKLPYVPYDPAVSEFHLYIFPQPGEFEYAVWQESLRSGDADARNPVLEHISWISGGRVVKTGDLPKLVAEPPGPLERFFKGMLPAPVWIVAAWQNDRTWTWTMPWTQISYCLILDALFWIPAGLWFGRRYRLSGLSQLGWALFNLIFGLPGFLTFLGVNEWPAREKCPNCHKPRVVNRESCEHCGAEFAPPEKTGAEIFAPLESIN